MDIGRLWLDDSDRDNHEERREEIAQLCRNKRLRDSAFSPDRPTKWNPQSVSSPVSGLPFTDAGAWNFVATCLEAGCPIEEIELDVPMGSTGYVLLISLPERSKEIYIKLQLGDGGKVIGRSFHYSDR